MQTSSFLDIAGQLVQRFNGPVFTNYVHISLFHEYSYYCLDLTLSPTALGPIGPRVFKG